MVNVSPIASGDGAVASTALFCAISGCCADADGFMTTVNTAAAEMNLMFTKCKEVCDASSANGFPTTFESK